MFFEGQGSIFLEIFPRFEPLKPYAAKELGLCRPFSLFFFGSAVATHAWAAPDNPGMFHSPPTQSKPLQKHANALFSQL